MSERFAFPPFDVYSRFVFGERRLTTAKTAGAESVSGACSVGDASLKTFFGALDVLNA